MRLRVPISGLALTVSACLLACSNGAPAGDDAAPSELTEGTDDALLDDPAAADDNPAVDDAAGDDGSGPSAGEPPAPADCASPAPGQAPLRRLTNAEYRNTATDLVGDGALVAEVTRNFPREPTSLGFRTSASALTVSSLIADEYLDAAHQLGQALVAREGAVPCSLEAAEPACTLAFIEDFGKHVYRRPLTAPELRRYSDLYNSVVAGTSNVRTAYEAMVGALFSSPHFLFRVELSQPATGAAGRPNGYEMATRLSYLLWQTMPDEPLFAAAEAGQLETAAGIEAQVVRMLGDSKALRVYEFFEQWLDLDEAISMTRNEVAYPEFTPSMVELFQAENRAFVYHLLTTSGTFAELLSAPYTFANRTLAEHYGLSEAPAGATFERVAAPERAGVLTQGSLLVHDRPGRSSIVKRGLKIRTDFLCQIVPAPPADVDTTLPELDGNLTQRERLAQHRENADCAGCHALMDPIGEIFEGLDAVGRPRTTDEAGAAIVPGGEITLTRSLNGTYNNPQELAQAMGQSDEVRSCFALQAFRFFYGRDATAADRCTREQLMASFERNDYRVVDLLVGLTQSDQFLYRAATPSGEQP